MQTPADLHQIGKVNVLRDGEDKGMAVRAPIHGPTLQWAREALGMDVTDLAASLNVSPQQVMKWESQETLPTLVQLRNIAKRLDRTPAFFFVAPPEDTGIPATPDFRGRQDEHLPAALLKEIKRAETYRRTFLELAGPPSTIELAPFSWNEMPARAAEFKAVVVGSAEGVDALARLSANEVFAYWRTKLEDLGFQVFQTTGIDVSTFRGLSIHHDVMPIILLNGADSAYGKVFTLFHEVGHLLNRSSGVCLVLDNSDVEALCNAFAAEVLMPAQRVELFLRAIPLTEAAEAIANRFKVSELAAAVRLKTLGMIDHAALEAARAASDERWAEARRRQTQRDGFVPHWRLRYRDLGPRYIKTVIRALETDRIDALDACYMLQTRVPTLVKMQEELHRSGEA